MSSSNEELKQSAENEHLEDMEEEIKLRVKYNETDSMRYFSWL